MQTRLTHQRKTGNAERVEYKSSLVQALTVRGRAADHKVLALAAGANCTPKVLQEMLSTYSENTRGQHIEQQRPQSAGARSSSSSAAKTSSRPENRPGAQPDDENRPVPVGAKLVRPGTAPARRQIMLRPSKKWCPMQLITIKPTMSKLESAVS